MRVIMLAYTLHEQSAKIYDTERIWRKIISNETVASLLHELAAVRKEERTTIHCEGGGLYFAKNRQRCGEGGGRRRGGGKRNIFGPRCPTVLDCWATAPRTITGRNYCRTARQSLRLLIERSISPVGLVGLQRRTTCFSARSTDHTKFLRPDSSLIL